MCGGDQDCDVHAPCLRWATYRKRLPQGLVCLEDSHELGPAKMWTGQHLSGVGGGGACMCGEPACLAQESIIMP